MFNKVLIIGCGLIGSSILRAIKNRKLARNIYIFEKSKKHISLIKKINKKIIFLKKLDHNISDVDLVVLSTPMSSYEKIIPNLTEPSICPINKSKSISASISTNLGIA